MLSPQDTFDGRYKIISELGHGGMGLVYKAYQSDLDRTVAIKILPKRNFSPGTIARFEREAMAMSTIQHPGVSSIYGFGLCRDLPYLVMEYVEGVSLYSQLINSEPLGTKRSLDLIGQLCKALAYVHAAGVVHRDLKPDNIMLIGNPDAVETVKIIDLGLARLLPGAGKEQQKLTETGVAVGTVLYMSPEQCMGGTADARSDVYALGVILHQCLTGTVPFSAAVPIDALVAHVSKPPPTLKRLNPEADVPGLQSVIYKALAKKPEERYQSADEMLADIEKIKAGRGQDVTVATKLHGRVNSEPPNPRSRGPIIATIGVLGVLAITAGVACIISMHFSSQNSERLYNRINEQVRNAELKLEQEKLPPNADLCSSEKNDLHINPYCTRHLSAATIADIEECLRLNQRDHLIDQIHGAQCSLAAIAASYYLARNDAKATAFVNILTERGKLITNETSGGQWRSGFLYPLIYWLVTNDSCPKQSWTLLINAIKHSNLRRGEMAQCLGAVASIAPFPRCSGLASDLLALKPGKNEVGSEFLIGTFRLMRVLDKRNPQLADRLCEMGLAYKGNSHEFDTELSIHYAFRRDWQKVLESSALAEPTTDLVQCAMRLYALEMLGRHRQVLSVLTKLEAGTDHRQYYFLAAPFSAFKLHGDNVSAERVSALASHLQRASISAHEELLAHTSNEAARARVSAILKRCEIESVPRGLFLKGNLLAELEEVAQEPVPLENL